HKHEPKRWAERPNYFEPRRGRVPRNSRTGRFEIQDDRYRFHLWPLPRAGGYRSTTTRRQLVLLASVENRLVSGARAYQMLHRRLLPEWTTDDTSRRSECQEEGRSASLRALPYICQGVLSR